MIINNIYKKLSGNYIIKDLSLNLENHEIVAIMGKNGAGKTTLLNTIVGLLTPSKGTIEINETDIFKTPSIRKLIGYIPIDHFFYDQLNAFENLELIGSLYGIKFKKKELKSLLEKVTISEEDAFKMVGNYSSGMKQKLNFASGLLHDPQYIILDEPFNALDPKATNDLQLILKELSHQGKTILFTSHLPDTIVGLADRVVILHNKKIVDEFRLDKSISNLELVSYFESKISEEGYNHEKK